jgi:hypothetical protein
MNVSSFVFEQVLKQLKIPAHAIRHLQIAGQLSDVDGSGFPAELFQLSAPMITRGLLNFALLQMRKDWLYPFWVNQQLDPNSKSFVARSQNPLLLNITHRNWTMLGSPQGDHEAIIDPRGLITPLPREWSIDTWLRTDDDLLFPSLTETVTQNFNTHAPQLTTTFQQNRYILELESFTGTIRSSLDVLFNKASVHNTGTEILDGWLFIALRPFNPEGAAPIHSVEFRAARQLFVNGALGVVFSAEPDWVHCSNAESGDCSAFIQKHNFHAQASPTLPQKSARCTTFLANAVAGFRFSLNPGGSYSIHHSVALGTEAELKSVSAKPTWRVSYESRRRQHEQQWHNERSTGLQQTLPDDRLQNIFDANVLTLLQLHDREFISPGPYLYHHFWFRDAAPMLHALDRLGFHKRVRQSIDGFWKYMTRDGFLKSPDGEWDSNGEVLWFLQQHFSLVSSPLWLRNIYPEIKRAAQWILTKRSQSTDTATTHRGLMPKSLSAEHFGTVDQYYWDSLWSAAGIRAAAFLARESGNEKDAEYYFRQFDLFAKDIVQSFERTAQRLGQKIIPAAPSRSFDEGAIGALCGIHPTQIHTIAPEYFSNTLSELHASFVNEHGFYHPIVHSGYNAYLTMHIAHAYLTLGQTQKAWNVAETIFRHCVSPYSLPEAIHPITGGGSMGDGHHGWAAAEILLFLLDILAHEDTQYVHFFNRLPESLWQQRRIIALKNLPTSIGVLNVQCEFASEKILWCTFERLTEQKHRVKELMLHLPFTIQRAVASAPQMLLEIICGDQSTQLRCLPGNFTLKIEI